jgi:hypothetical protein
MPPCSMLLGMDFACMDCSPQQVLKVLKSILLDLLMRAYLTCNDRGSLLDNG